MDKTSGIYILGGNGYIGSAFMDLIKDDGLSVTKIGRSSKDDIFLDLSDESLDLSFVFKKNAKLIFLSAISSPDQCEKNFEYAYRVNVINTSAVIEKALSEGVSVLFASTDAVYGDSHVEVSESSRVSPSSVYGKMKAEVESIFLGRKGFSSARFSYVWSLHDRFTQAVIDAFRSSESFQVYDPFYRSVISLEDVICFLKSFLEKDSCPGLINLAGPELLSRKDLIGILRDKIDVKYEIIYPGEDFFKSRPKCINMKSEVFFDYMGRNSRPISELLSKKMLSFEVL